MTSAGLAHSLPYPGATTCILLGAIPAGSPAPDLGAYRAVLWLTPTASASPPRVAPGARLQMVVLSPAIVESLGTVVEQFIRLDARKLPTVHITNSAVGPDVAICEPALARIQAELEMHHRARVTRQQDGFTWQKHLLQNLPAYVRRGLPESWRGALAGTPAFVCGAGPSLDVSAPRLAEAAGSGVVLAADSALRTLAKHGIAADIGVSIDIAKVPDKCVPEGVPLPRRMLLASISPPAWLEVVPDARTFFVANRQLTNDWLVQRGLPAPAVAVAESCGVTALELARFLGCAPIHLFGLDLALSDNQRHTSGADAALYTKSGFDASQKYPKVPGNFSDTVATHAIGDWRSLDRRLAGWPAGLVTNVNDRGARLSNTTVIHPKDFVPPKAVREKSTALAGAPTIDQARAAAALGELRDVAKRHATNVPAMRAALATGGPPALVEAFRQSFSDELLGRVLGGFSLKLMPHLLPPTEGDAESWKQLLDEYAELLDLAKALP